jgi:hypothetical protein
MSWEVLPVNLWIGESAYCAHCGHRHTAEMCLESQTILPSRRQAPAAKALFQARDNYANHTWISVVDKLPDREGLYLVHAPSLEDKKPLICTAWFSPNGGSWSFLPSVWAEAVSHW